MVIIEKDINKNMETEKDIKKLKRTDKGVCASCKRHRIIKDFDLYLCKTCLNAKKYWIGFNEKKINNNIDNDISVSKEIETEAKIEPISYFCDYCNNKIAYASKKCNKCGNILNWLGTKLEYDTNYLICGSCGMILEFNANKCERCL